MEDLSMLLLTLGRLGLSEYGAKTYAALVEGGPSGVGSLARRTGIPRARLYDVLQRLRDHAFVEVVDERPLRFKARPPRDALADAVRFLEAQVEQAAVALESLYTREHRPEADLGMVLQGTAAVRRKARRMVEEAKRRVLLLQCLPQTFRELEDLLAAREGLACRVATDSLPVLARARELGLATVSVRSPARFLHETLVADDQVLTIYSPRSSRALQDRLGFWVGLPEVAAAVCEAAGGLG